jgi:hypothetical protein
VLVAREQQRVDFERVRAAVRDSAGAVPRNRNRKRRRFDQPPPCGGSHDAVSKFMLRQLCCSPAPVEASDLRESRALPPSGAGLSVAVARCGSSLHSALEIWIVWWAL